MVIGHHHYGNDILAYSQGLNRKCLQVQNADCSMQYKEATETKFILTAQMLMSSLDFPKNNIHDSKVTGNRAIMSWA